MHKTTPAIVTPMSVQDYLDALITIYVDEYLKGVEQAPTDLPYQSPYEPLVKRAMKAYEGIIKHPGLFEDIYDDFKLEFQEYGLEISKVIAVRQHVW